MGIQGLLPLLKSIMVPIHIKDLHGCSVAIDTYSWLHKAALSCSLQICKGLPTSRHIEYCMHRVNLLRHHGVKPVLVFDGGLLPMKSEQENKRARVRRENLARAIEHESNGNSAAAYECYQKAVDISPALAFELIQVLKQENVSYVVAPYEADAQMTFLAISKQVDAVITEDSDLIPFGCPRIIFKMDKFGQGIEFQYSRLQQSREISFTGFTKQMLLEMCILSGCDYLQSLPGMGLKRAHALIKKFKSYEKAVKHLRFSKVSVPQLYEESFKKAIWTFCHQRVYDPRTEDIVHLHDLSDDIGDDLDFLGPLLSQQVAKGIANGDLNPFTEMPFKGQKAGAGGVACDETYLLKNFKLDSERRKIDLPVQKNLLTNYFCFASLEAKRKFRVPRNTEKHPNVRDGLAPSVKEHPHGIENAAACRAICSPASLLDCGNLDGGPLSEDSVEEGAITKIPENLNSPLHVERNDEKDVVDNTRSSEYALLQQPLHALRNPSPAPCKEHEHRNVFDAVGGKMKTENRKVMVRSSYFQHKSDNETETRPLMEDTATVLCANNSPESFSFDKFSYKGSVMKRKATNFNNSHTETKQTKCVQPDASNSKKSKNSDDSFTHTKAEEGNFGCNISHLSQYSDIAEKSIENFVSVISSFRYSSSGSRASGLRAPLKDVKNTRNDGPTVELDFSKFAYLPNNRKTASATHRD